MNVLDQVVALHGGAQVSIDTPQFLPVQHVYGHDRNTFKIANELDSTIGDPAKISLLRLYMDHYAPPPTAEIAELHSQQRGLAREHGLFLSEVGGGVGHQVAVERLVSSGQIAVGVDSHTCTVGGLGALGLRQPPVAVAQCLELGTVRFDMPRVLRVHLEGRLPGDCGAKDVMLHLAAAGRERYEDVLMEFGGPGLGSLPMNERFTLANLSVDLGARTSLVETDELTAGYLRESGRGDAYVHLEADGGWDDEIVLNLDDIVPMISIPPSINRAVPVTSLVEPVKVDVVTIGSCTNGRLEDFEVFVDELDGHVLGPGVRLLATPASEHVMRRLIESGHFQTLIAAGAVFNPPGCGPCMGLHQGALAGNEVCLATGSRNSQGRMGSKDALVYLVGPRVAAASAKTGFISQPTKGREALHVRTSF